MNFGKNLVVWIIIVALAAAFYTAFQGSVTPKGQGSFAYSDFLLEVENGRVADVIIQGEAITGHYTNGSSFSTYAPYDIGIVEKLRKANVKITAAPRSDESQNFWSIVLSWAPMLVFLGVWIFFMRQMQSTGGKAMGEKDIVSTQQSSSGIL